MSAKDADRRGITPLARIVAAAHCGVDPAIMGIGPVPARRRLFERTGLGPDDIDLYEMNEAFAAQVLACLRALEQLREEDFLRTLPEQPMIVECSEAMRRAIAARRSGRSTCRSSEPASAEPGALMRVR